jgi:hypothetical protein
MTCLVQGSRFKVREARILSFEGSFENGKRDPSLRSGRALNVEPLNYSVAGYRALLFGFSTGRAKLAST